MRAPAGCKLVGRWRVVEADIWDRDYLDLCGAAAIVISDDGRGEIAFGAMQATSNMDQPRSPSNGLDSTKWTKFPVKATRN